MKISPAGRLLVLGSMILSACGPVSAGIEAEPTPTVNPEPLAAAACAGFINEAQLEMDTFLKGEDASKAQSLCTTWLESNWYMADNQPYLLGQTAVVYMDEKGLPVNDYRGHDLAVMLQNQISSILRGTSTPSPAPLTSGQ
jgi:hypothetical protein